jgi:hypothetical protein
MPNSTLILDQTTWDLLADNSGNIAVATVPYSYAQDSASAIRTFLGEVYYDTTQGVPYFENIFGKAPPISLMKAYFAEAALTVPGVEKAQAFITEWKNRKVTGQVQIMDEDGNTAAAGF